MTRRRSKARGVNAAAWFYGQSFHARAAAAAAPADSYYTRPAEVIGGAPATARAAIEVGDEVVDLHYLERGSRITGVVVKLQPIDGVPHAVVRGPGGDADAVAAWLVTHPVTRFRRAAEVAP